MDLFFLRDCLGRIRDRKRVLLLFFGLYFTGAVLGMCFIYTPSVYGYHLDVCRKFMDGVCFSDRNVFLIFIEHAAEGGLLLAVILAAGMHCAGLVVPPVLLLYRAYTFGGSVVIFFSVYRVTGVLVVFLLFLPVRLLTDGLLICATVLSCARAANFRFCRPDFLGLALDLAALFIALLAVCLLELVLLAAVFHPIGDLF